MGLKFDFRDLGGAGCRGQNRTQREKSYSKMLVTFFPFLFLVDVNIFFKTSQVRCADMPAARRKINFFTFLNKQLPNLDPK